MRALLVILLSFGCDSFAPATRTLPRAARLRSAPADAEIDLAALRENVACAEGVDACRLRLVAVAPALSGGPARYTR